MQLADLERLCVSLVPGTGAVEIQPLATGLLSATYRVTRGGVAYALKVAAAGGVDLGLSSAWEARVQELAASARLSPPVVYADPKRALMLSSWMPGVPWPVEDVKLPENTRRITALLRRVHALSIPPSPRVMGPAAWVRLYDTAWQRAGGRAVDAVLRRTADACLQELSGLRPAVGVVCHSDLHRMNLIQHGEALCLLDWEYAHVSDPFWDLAGWAANNDFEAQLQRELLSSYLRAVPSAEECTRFELLLWLYDYVCLLWSELYLSARAGGADDIARRATLLDARLRLPAHYAPHAECLKQLPAR